MFAPQGTAAPFGIDEPFSPEWQTFTADIAAAACAEGDGEG